MKATLQVDGQFGDDGPGKGERLIVLEIHKFEGEYWATAIRVVGQDAYESYVVKLDHLMTANTENTETVWTTA